MALTGYQRPLLRQPEGLVRINEKHWLANSLLFAHSGRHAFVWHEQTAIIQGSIGFVADTASQSGNAGLQGIAGWVPDGTAVSKYPIPATSVAGVTLSVWQTGPAAATTDNLLAVRRTSLNGGVSVRRLSSELVSASAADSAGSTAAATAAGGYVSNKWQHVVGSFISATSRWIYIDGGGGVQNTTSRTAVSATEVGILLGADGTVGTPCTATIKGVALPMVLARALNAEEVERLYLDQLSNPWQLFAERPIWVPVSAAGGGALNVSASSLSLSGSVTASGNLQRDLNLSASAVSLAGSVSTAGDLAVYVPMLNVSAGALAVTGAVAATGDIGVGANLSAGTVALSGALTATGDVQIGTAFALSAGSVSLAGAVTASGDIQIAEEALLDVLASPLSISGSVSVAGDLAYLVPQLDVEASALALSGSVDASGDIRPELQVDLGSGSVALSGSVDIAGELGVGTSFNLSTDPIVVSGAAAISGDIAAEVVDVSAAAVWSYVLANGKTAGETLIENNEMLRIVMAAVAGTSAGVGTDTETYFGTDGTTPRVIATFDGQGNRSSVTVDGSP